MIVSVHHQQNLDVIVITIIMLIFSHLHTFFVNVATVCLSLLTEGGKTPNHKQISLEIIIFAQRCKEDKHINGLTSRHIMSQ